MILDLLFKQLKSNNSREAGAASNTLYNYTHDFLIMAGWVTPEFQKEYEEILEDLLKRIPADWKYSISPALHEVLLRTSVDKDLINSKVISLHK